ncbi:thiol:disulfide interchange protein DsbA/DsbL [Ramlibacter sp. 2FC]|uniref:thiol:disulfide interchange protein DsbA/DsbL n=1 Tax=Ramlibacter sp. 2FC TaxID=2502188 RepID=UPI0010FA1CDC|nr:thiol:disulfide interchange protein DsbA/DsbL [Ramlibacter sp. 2FC]
MKRREFSMGAAAVALAGVPALSSAQAFKPREGKDYIELDKRVPVETGAGKVEVIEFFWYSCPHCNAFEPAFDAWVKAAPKDVSVRRVPVAFRDDFAPQQRLYYTLEAMNKLEELHRKVFHAVHVERQALNRDETILAWAEKQGLDKAKFAEVYKSFGVASKLRRAVQLQEAFKVEGVPSLGIAGRYYTDGSLAGSMERALQVVNYLVDETRKGR